MPQLLRKDAKFFLAGSLAGLALRLIFVQHFPAIVDDSRLYGDIAMNWLQYGIYGVTDSGHVVLTLSRLPGYPGFLAGIFAIFGWANFRAVLLVQTVVDLATCFLIADISRRMFSERAARAAFMLAALCPFLANYSAAALTETLEIFFTTLALDFALRGLAQLRHNGMPHSDDALWAGCGFSIGACILLRPDGGILLAAVGGYLFLFLGGTVLRQKTSFHSALPILRAAAILAFTAILPLIPWTLRNLRTLHRFEPLAPRYANDSDEPVMPGFNRWIKTWIEDYASVQEIYWNVPGAAIDAARLPRRSFDSESQRRETLQLFAEYNSADYNSEDNPEHDMTPELDAGFAALAAARVRAAPLRYYLWLPAVRIADMWLRPRTELLPPDPRWWEFDDDPPWLAVSVFFGLLNLAYVLAGAIGLFRYRAIFGIELFVLFLALRSLFLGTLENPEPRYTLECYPIVIIAAAALLIGKANRKYPRLP